jgi:CheY-like chemotaxis protein
MTEQRSVLVVDDDAAMREMLTSLLAEAGIRAQTAKTAEDAMEALRNGEFDAVLSDIRMPGKSGYDLIGELRELRPETPVILMTAFGSLDSAVERRCGPARTTTLPSRSSGRPSSPHSSVPSSAGSSSARTEGFGVRWITRHRSAT